MMQRLRESAMVGLAVTLLCAAPASAQTFSSGSTGADGAFNPPAGLTTLTVPPSGVFNFTTINMPFNAAVRFTRNATNTPVTWLATGNVTIAGTLDISGATGTNGRIGATAVGSSGGQGGPGGFDGGSGAPALVTTTGGAGLGPGGGTGSTGATAGGGGAGHVLAGQNPTGTGAGSGGPAYGTPSLLPLVGGSGGGGGGATGTNTGAGGGGGGGALVIASSGTITIGGTSTVIQAQGGFGGNGLTTGLASGGGGSGGSVRLIANSVTGTGATINIAGGTAGGGVGPGGAGSAGRLRVEAFTNTLSVNLGTSTVGVVSTGAPTSVVLPNAPSLRIVSVAGVAAPAAPAGSFTVADVVLPPTTTNPVAVSLQAANIPLGTTILVTAKALYDPASAATSTPLTGTVAASTATASVTIPTNQPSIVSASASFVLTAASGGGPVFVNGEEIERVRVTATPDGASSVAYVTKSGREVPVSAAR